MVKTDFAVGAVRAQNFSRPAARELLEDTLAQCDTIVVAGPTASGKTTAVREIAAALHQPIREVNLSSATTVEDLLGRYEADPGTSRRYHFEPGPGIQALRNDEWLLVQDADLYRPQPNEPDVLADLAGPNPHAVVPPTEEYVTSIDGNFKLILMVNG